MNKEYTLEERLIVTADFSDKKYSPYFENASFNDCEFDTFKDCNAWIFVNRYSKYKPQLMWSDEFPLGKFHVSYEWLMPVWVKFRDYSQFKDEVPIEWEAIKQNVGFSILEDNIEKAFTELSNAIIWLQSLNKETNAKKI